MNAQSQLLTAWNKIKARFVLAGLRVNQVKKELQRDKKTMSFSALVNHDGFCCANEAYKKEIRAIVDNELEGSKLVWATDFEGLKVYLTIVCV